MLLLPSSASEATASSSSICCNTLATPSINSSNELASKHPRRSLDLNPRWSVTRFYLSHRITICYLIEIPCPNLIGSIIGSHLRIPCLPRAFFSFFFPFSCKPTPQNKDRRRTILLSTRLCEVIQHAEIWNLAWIP